MADVDVELGNIQDSVQTLLDCTQNATKRSSCASVHMIPSRVRNMNPNAFNPRVVSIGPLHRKDESLVAFEGQKAIFVHDLLLHTGLPPEQTLKTCLQKVYASIHRIRAFYDGIDTNYNDDEIARMMVMDACFILEFIYKSYKEDLCDENMVLPQAILSLDLLLIENQIPFFVLQDVFECTCSRFTRAIASLNQLIFDHVQALYIFNSDLTIKNDTITHDHILGLFHEYYRPSHPLQSTPGNLQIHSTVDLDRAGVNFEPHHGDLEWPMAMKLELPSRFLSFSWPWAKPTLRMPQLFIIGDTEVILRNLVAYEQFTPQVRRYITSYALAMDMLVNTEEDVSILVESKVVVNLFGSNKEAANMLNHICDEAEIGDFYYCEEFAELGTYYNSYWPKNIAWLRRTYFSSPWSMIALLGGILLFLLTLVQTYFTINPL